MGYLLTDLSDLMTSGGITTTIYQGWMPPTPDEAFQLVITGGYSPIRAMAASPGQAKVERPTVQIVRRSRRLLHAFNEMEQVWRMLDGNGDREINGTRYEWMESVGQPFDLGRDDAERVLVGMNLMIAREPSTATST